MLMRLIFLPLALISTFASANNAFYGTCQRALDVKRIEQPVDKAQQNEYRFYFCSCLQMNAINSWGIRTSRSSLRASEWLNTRHGEAGKASCQTYALGKMGIEPELIKKNRQFLAAAR